MLIKNAVFSGIFLIYRKTYLERMKIFVRIFSFKSQSQQIPYNFVFLRQLFVKPVFYE